MDQPGNAVSYCALPKRSVTWAIHHRGLTVGVGVTGLILAIYLAFGGVIGSEFLPHLDEGALWVRGTLAQSAGPTEGIDVCNKARILLCSYPEVTNAPVRRVALTTAPTTPDFFNTEYFVGLKPKEQWRPVFHQNKDNLIASMTAQLEKNFPGVAWGFSQPIEDNMEEAVSGVKGELATKVYGDDLHLLEAKADEIAGIMNRIPGIADLGVFQVTGQPDLDVVVDRAKAARWQVNVADVQDAIQTAVGGNALTQVLRGEEVYDLTLRYLPQYRDTREAIKDIRLLSPSGRASFARAALLRSRKRTRVPRSIAKTTNDMSPSNTAYAAALLGTQSEKPSRRSTIR